ncbi:hypothetical protein VHEMI06146 [[Torrubiella] hemipterigena]|uniref:2-dehydropantoate 2-reductase n=1 Tax=[Torrubiella] hemipterigena TaxID=1531966 RepID=A0A0A1SZU2_9HYPO|nr:hypothetical protein VHEMI06146 [[Torrubiella] hemipterigena]
MSKPLELLVFGTGAVGSVFGWRTAQNANVKLSAICRSNYEIVKNRGLTFRSNMWGTGSMRPVRVARHSNELSHVKFDYVVCATKNKPQEEHALMRSLEPLLSKDTTLVLIQNGVEIEHPFRRAFPNHTLLSSICFASCSMQGSTVLQPANIRPHGFHVGIHGNGNTSASKDEERLHTLVGLDPKFKAVDNIAAERWAKMAWNGAWNPATALFGLETQDILQHSPAGTSLVRQLAKEVIQVAQVYGVELPPNYEDEIIRMTEVEASIAPSMLQDLRRGQRMEVETICGKCKQLIDEKKQKINI